MSCWPLKILFLATGGTEDAIEVSFHGHGLILRPMVLLKTCACHTNHKQELSLVAEANAKMAVKLRDISEQTTFKQLQLIKLNQTS
jgi:hypothetical protein